MRSAASSSTCGHTAPITNCLISVMRGPYTCAANSMKTRPVCSKIGGMGLFGVRKRFWMQKHAECSAHACRKKGSDTALMQAECTVMLSTSEQNESTSAGLWKIRGVYAMHRINAEITRTMARYTIADSGTAPLASNSTRQARPVYIFPQMGTHFIAQASDLVDRSAPLDHAARVMLDLDLAALLAAVSASEARPDGNAITPRHLLGKSATDLAHLTFPAEKTAHGRNRLRKNIANGLVRLHDLVDARQSLLEHNDNCRRSHDLGNGRLLSKSAT